MILAMILLGNLTPLGLPMTSEDLLGTSYEVLGSHRKSYEVLGGPRKSYEILGAPRTS